MGAGYKGMRRQRADEQGVLPTAWDQREELLLLAPEDSDMDMNAVAAIWHSLQGL